MNNSNSILSSPVHSYLPGNVWHQARQNNCETVSEIKVESTPPLKKIVINDRGDLPVAIGLGVIFLVFLFVLVFGCKDM